MKYKMVTQSITLCALLSITLAFSSLNASAQNFTFSPEKSFEGEYPSNGFGSHTINIVNQTSVSLVFEWKVLINTFATGWSNALCDFGSCYPVIPDSSRMDPTTPGGDAYFICYGFFNDVSTKGILQLFVYEAGDEANGDTVTFKFTTTDPVGLAEDEKHIVSYEFYPNPVTSTIFVELADFRSLSNLKIYNLLGQQIWNLDKPNSSSLQIPIGDLKQGTYFIISTQQDGKQYMRKFQKLDL